MVIMEYIEGETLAKAKPSLNNETTTTVRLELERAIKLLHDQGFNWAGEQTKYPCLISPGIDWPEGVEALATIEKAHDLEMLNRLFSTS
jgi:hypothetical protein